MAGDEDGVSWHDKTAQALRAATGRAAKPIEPCLIPVKSKQRAAAKIGISVMTNKSNEPIRTTKRRLLLKP